MLVAVSIPCISDIGTTRSGEEENLVPMDSQLLPPMTNENRDSGSEWLGVHMLTPHYKSVTFAVKPPCRTMRSALDTILQTAPPIPDRVFDTVLPVHPQRFRDFGTFIRFSSSIRSAGVGGQAAVVVDLTHVGGHYFATVLPKELSYEALTEFLYPLTSDDDRPLSLFIGYTAL